MQIRIQPRTKYTIIISYNISPLHHSLRTVTTPPPPLLLSYLFLSYSSSYSYSSAIIPSIPPDADDDAAVDPVVHAAHENSPPLNIAHESNLKTALLELN